MSSSRSASAAGLLRAIAGVDADAAKADAAMGAGGATYPLSVSVNGANGEKFGAVSDR